jgi:hypothetical protein
MISLITTGRDDDYGHGFLDRLYLSIENNVKILHEYNIPYEYIICEWNPERDYLINHPKFKNLFENYNVKEVIISNSVVEKEGLNKKVFFEYFSKNAGVRNSLYDNILILNSDIVIPKKSFDIIIDKIKIGLNPNNFYRLLNRDQIDNDFNFITTETIYYPQNPDAVICGFCSGDFLLLKKETFVKNGQGYDETNLSHRTISQTGMDGEILWNMYFSGIRIELIDSNYQHINHGKPNPYDNHYNQSGYTNKLNWGFVDYEHQKVSEKLVIIK